VARVNASVDKRLPDDVFVVGGRLPPNLPDWTEQVRWYLQLASAVPNWSTDAFVMMNEPFLMAPKIGDQNIVCNVCKEYTVSADNTVFTFTLRKGLKWSDACR
jgi:peptide/nickel transport system substrate-binding protein